jgi:hypothetical protein
MTSRILKFTLILIVSISISNCQQGSQKARTREGIKSRKPSSIISAESSYEVQYICPSSFGLRYNASNDRCESVCGSDEVWIQSEYACVNSTKTLKEQETPNPEEDSETTETTEPNDEVESENKPKEISHLFSSFIGRIA